MDFDDEIWYKHNYSDKSTDCWGRAIQVEHAGETAGKS